MRWCVHVSNQHDFRRRLSITNSNTSTKDKRKLAWKCFVWTKQPYIDHIFWKIFLRTFDDSKLFFRGAQFVLNIRFHLLSAAHTRRRRWPCVSFSSDVFFFFFLDTFQKGKKEGLRHWRVGRSSREWEIQRWNNIPKKERDSIVYAVIKTKWEWSPRHRRRTLMTVWQITISRPPTPLY